LSVLLFRTALTALGRLAVFLFFAHVFLGLEISQCFFELCLKALALCHLFISDG
jgi:hypothetical protein